MTDTPNPGSAEAIALGCTCPRWDNRNGAGVVIDGERVWCPLHGTQTEEASNDEAKA